MPIYLRMRILILTFLALLHTAASAQSIQRLWNQKNYEAIYEQRDRIHRMSGPDMLRVAQAAQHFDEDSIAIYILNTAIEKGYEDDQTYYVRGLSFAKQRHFISAAESFHQALALNQHRLPYMLAKADAYYRGQKPDSALAVFNRIHLLYPNKDVATFMSCKILEEQGYMQAAIECFEGNIRDMVAKEYRVEASEILASLYWHEGEDSARAAAIYRELIDNNPNKVNYRLNLLQLTAEMGEWDMVAQQQEAIHQLRDSDQLPSIYTRKNALPILSLMGVNFRIEIYEIIRPDLKDNAIYEAFLITPLHARPVGKWSYIVENGERKIVGEGRGAEEFTIETELNLMEFSIFMRSIERKL